MQHALDLIAALLGFAALFGYLNLRFLKLPTAIGLVIIALLASIAVLLLDQAFPEWQLADNARDVVTEFGFSDALMKGMLSFLLFAGAMHVDLSELAKRGWAIGTLATAGVLISTTLVGVGTWLLFSLLGLQVPLIYCLVFGALIAPTDPVAVLGILKTLTVPKSLETKIAGESLFNDGVGVVVFTLLVAIAAGGETAAPDPTGIALLFVREAVGGALLGLVTGAITFYAMRSVDEYNLEVIMTLALVTVTYSLAHAFHMSGPIAVVVSGLFIGNAGTRLAMSPTTREHLHTFWKLVDEILNAVLFLLIGLEVFALHWEASHMWAALLVIPLTLVARYVSVAGPLSLLSLKEDFTPGAIPALTWGGLRGGISVALALSLPADWAAKELILTVTYGVVVFSIVIQGTTVAAVIRRFVRE
jgi:CPA1 family monovalent cation:H+ antiporter